MSNALTLRLMTKDEAYDLMIWADDEGWAPGRHDAGVLWDIDPQAFVAAVADGHLVGGGTVGSYGSGFGFVGPCLVGPPFRGRGLGGRLWQTQLQLLRGRLDAAGTIGLDGVDRLHHRYLAHGFEFSHRMVRYEGRGQAADAAPGIVPAAEVPFERLAAYDRRCFPASREAFLRAWLEQPEALALAATGSGQVQGYGVIRRCRVGARIGPLFADDAEAAEVLYTALASFVPGAPVYLDVPEVNAWAMALARRHEMGVRLVRARMYLGPPPRLEESRVYGITGLELG